MTSRTLVSTAAATAFILALAGCTTETADTGDTVDATATASGTEQSTTTEAAAAECGADHEVNIYLARHGRTMLNTVDRSQGWIDAPLTPAGIEVAEALGRGTADIEFDAVYSSTSARAAETATIVLETKGQDELVDTLMQDPRLREYNFGTFEGMPNEEMIGDVADELGLSAEEILEGNYADAIEVLTGKLAEMDAEGAEPGVNWPAEDYETVATRAMEALDSIAADAHDNCLSDVLVVSHGMTITTVAAELGAKDEVPTGGPSNSSVTLITHRDGDYMVESVGDTQYLEAGQNS